MNNSYLLKERSKYFDSDPKGLYCVGNKNLCSHFEADGAIRIPWGEEPDRRQFKNIEKLYILPAKSQVMKAILPSYINELSNLHFLSIPYPFIPNLKDTKALNSLTSLMINNIDDYPDSKKTSWPDLILSNLEGLIFLGDYEPSMLWIKSGLTPALVPNLKYLKTYIDKKGEVLNEIQKFNTLSHLEIEMVYDHDIVEKINSPLATLDISVTNAKIPISNIAKIKTLKILRLRSVKAEIDCVFFTTLPNLIEIEIINSKKIKNIDSLLSCKNLKNLSLTNCGSPIKKEMKIKFENAGFEKLDIKYA